MRRMYDAIRVNAHTLVGKVQPDDLLAIYLTGSSDIRWTSTEVALFPHVKQFVRIDQGGQTSPQFQANVIDVEPGAWTPANADAEISHFASPQTIYVDRSQLPDVKARVPIWLAAPGLSDAQAIALAKTDSRIVAVQNVWANTYDSSIVVNDGWMAIPVPPKPVGLPTGIVFSTFSTEAQINAKCNPTDGPESDYEWQLELLGIKGWSLVQQFTTTGPLATFAKLEPKQHYRFRVTRGTWSNWVNANT